MVLAADNLVPMAPATRRRRLPAEVYWRRRFLLMAIILLLIWGAYQIFGRDAQPKEPAARQAATAPAPPTATPAASNMIAAKLPEASKDCRPENVRIVPTVASGQYTQAPVKMSFLLSTSQKESCTFEPAAADILVVINANGSAVWDSSVCKDAFFPDRLVIPARWGAVVSASWSGRGSGASCAKNTAYGSPGSYEIKAATLGGEPGKDTFSLSSAPKPKADKTTEPAPDAKKSKKTADKPKKKKTASN